MAMLHLHGENPWKLGLGFLMLALFFGLGLAQSFALVTSIGALVFAKEAKC
jgi:hypothetical protein